MSQTPNNQWGDLDSDDIASVASDDLYENRPNRWRGPQATWRERTRQERELWGSLAKLRDQDLGVHLYNAFALKRQGREGDQGLMIRTNDGQNAVWAPPKSWTAWPVKVNEVPDEGLFKKEDDEDEVFTYRKLGEKMPSSELHEELSAHIIRHAKESFTRKMDKAKQQQQQQQLQKQQRGGAQKQFVLKSIEDVSSAAEMTEGDADDWLKPERFSSIVPDRMNVDEADEKDNVGGSLETTPGESGTSKLPQVSADDEYSEELLRAPVRSILSTLDKTLTILHYGRSATVRNLSDSSDTDEDTEATETEGGVRMTAATVKRGRGRPRHATSVPMTPTKPRPSVALEDNGPSTSIRPEKRDGRGRPRKEQVRLHGETDEEMAIRIAKENHRAMPATQKERDEAFEAWLRKGDQKLRRAQRKRDREEMDEELKRAAVEDEEGKSWKEQKLDRLGLRDWSDVLGAAALAGFSPKVLDRAAKRCAALFGQGMVMRTLDEIPIGRTGGEGGVREKVYMPETIDLGGGSEESAGEEEEQSHLRRVRIERRRVESLRRRTGSASSRASTPAFGGRGSTTIPSSVPSSPSAAGGSPMPLSPSVEPSRSRSRSTAIVSLYCPVPSCPRAVQGFTRRPNLTRHIERVHGGQSNPLILAAGGDTGGGGYASSSGYTSGNNDWSEEEEMVGGVRNDGFLRMIEKARGWREADQKDKSMGVGAHGGGLQRSNTGEDRRRTELFGGKGKGKRRAKSISSNTD